VVLKFTRAFKLLLGFIALPLGLGDGRDDGGRPASGNAGLMAHRRACRSGLKTVLRRCAHGATFAQAAEKPLKMS